MIKLVNLLWLTLVLLFIVTGCAFSTKHYSSSVVQYLYPKKEGVIETPTIPNLTLPLRVGVAFVPEAGIRSQALTERNKMELMKNVSDHFKHYEFIKSIEIIPSAYLTPMGSFANLNQIKTMYGIDVIALLSFDQSQFTDEGLATITYWTLIGAFVVPGEKNDTQTMLDAAVYDIQSQKMLFRAPGTSRIKNSATPVNLSEQKRLDSEEGFKQASKELVTNLVQQLEMFKEKLKEQPENYKIEHGPGYTGGGSLDASILIIMGLLICGYWIWKKTTPTA
ncbi:MAG: rhombotarget lipoprotein [Proteobacteria bacterium]|nr:rhombotarget lipoprotein [Pseudomonadota bacterium]MBU1716482.1 rhombotarget lipoprotein [Pseudomonadota bacterium]